MDKQRFLDCCEQIRQNGKEINGIGTMGEKSLHATLKLYFEQYSANHETAVGDYVADIVGENGIIEIQTGSFERLKKKLADFLPLVRVTVVYPVSVNNIICSVREDGTVSRRKSPVHCDVFSLFDEAYKIRDYLGHSNLTLCLMMLETEEYRIPCSKKARRKGYEKLERIATGLNDEIYFNAPSDYGVFLPESLPSEFSSNDLAKALGINANKARLILYTFRSCGFVRQCGKRGNAFLYSKLI